jgi:hypothetical protein
VAISNASSDGFTGNGLVVDAKHNTVIGANYRRYGLFDMH